MNEMDAAIQKWGEALDSWEAAAMHEARVEADFKSWEAGLKSALIKAQGVPMNRAESAIRATVGWGEKYINLQKAVIASEKSKRRLRLCEARWETERSKHATARKV